MDSVTLLPQSRPFTRTDLREGEYVEQAHVASDEVFDAVTPVHVEFAPAALVR